jgi:CHAT domain-containing protein
MVEVGRRISPLLLACVLLVAAACRSAEPPPTDAAECRALGLREVGRAIEPRLAGLSEWQACAGLRSGACRSAHFFLAPVSSLPNTCPDDVVRQVSALRTLIRSTAESEETLTMLEASAHRPPQDALRWNDLAVAHHLRAEREHRPTDRVRAYAAVHRALALDPTNPEALFNRALISEGILPPSLSVPAWDDALAVESDPAWAAEARERRGKLVRDRDEIAARSWDATERALLAAATDDDRVALRGLVPRYPDRTLRLVVETLLGSWASAEAAGATAEAAEALAQARSVAEVLDAATGDRLAHDAVATIEKALADSDRNRIADLVVGHTPGSPRESTRVALERAGSPWAFWQELGTLLESTQAALVCDPPEFTRLGELAGLCEQASYRHLAAQAWAQRGYCLEPEVASLVAYETTLRLSGRDGEMAARTQVRHSAILLVLGDPAAAWDALAEAIRNFDALSEVTERMTLLITTSALASELEAPDLALELLDAAIAEGARKNVAVLPESLRLNLAVAHRTRAQRRAERGDLGAAEADIASARRLTAGHIHEARLLPFLRVAEAELAAAREPRQAVRLFTAALAQIDIASAAYLRARLSFRRAELHRRLGDKRLFESDLRRGLELIEAEERRNLEAGRFELGDPYFDRFTGVGEQLVTLLLDSNRAPETFHRIERARAYEPLTRLRDLPLAPTAFQEATRGDRPLDPTRLQAGLPAGTALLSYSVLPDRLLVWVFTSTSAQPLVLPVGRPAIREWAQDIRRALRTESGLQAALEAPYPTLVGAPLAQVAGEPIERLVLVLDEDLHQIPFAALRAPASGRYLIEDHLPSVAPSATLYLYSLQRDAAMPRLPEVHALLVGNPAFDRNSPLGRGLPHLPDAEAEVLRIRHHYPRTSVILGPHATRRRWLAELPAAVVVHYGGHAVANALDPARSFLHLAPEGTVPGELFARELLGDRPLPHTRLAVLAACSTAGGRPIGPLGLAPLVRPFFEAGVPGVVGTLWDVDSSAARAFSERFHASLEQGHDAASAVREAQLDLLHSDSALLRSPDSWAAYTLVGFASSPFQPEAKHSGR